MLLNLPTKSVVIFFFDGGRFHVKSKQKTVPQRATCLIHHFLRNEHPRRHLSQISASEMRQTHEAAVNDNIAPIATSKPSPHLWNFRSGSCFGQQTQDLISSPNNQTKPCPKCRVRQLLPSACLPKHNSVHGGCVTSKMQWVHQSGVDRQLHTSKQKQRVRHKLQSASHRAHWTP